MMDGLESLADALCARYRGFQVWPARRFCIFSVHANGIAWIAVIGGLRGK